MFTFESSDVTLIKFLILDKHIYLILYLFNKENYIFSCFFLIFIHITKKHLTICSIETIIVLWIVSSALTGITQGT